MGATCCAHRILLDLIILIIWEYKLSSSFFSFLQPPFTSSFTGPNILLKHPQSAFLP
jgi:hypothetical protein